MHLKREVLKLVLPYTVLIERIDVKIKPGICGCVNARAEKGHLAEGHLQQSGCV